MFSSFQLPLLVGDSSGPSTVLPLVGEQGYPSARPLDGQKFRWRIAGLVTMPSSIHTTRATEIRLKS
jgi:hypothetical protein